MKAIVLIACFCVAISGVIFSGMLSIMMIGEINRKRDDGNQVSYFGFVFPAILNVFSGYRARYPEGKLNFFAMLALVVWDAELLKASGFEHHVSVVNTSRQS